MQVQLIRTPLSSHSCWQRVAGWWQLLRPRRDVCLSVGEGSRLQGIRRLCGMFLDLNLVLLPFPEPSWTECGIEVFRVVQMGDSFSVAGLR